MKCSICNTENPSDATSCRQCGFGFDLGQPAWPEFPTIEIPESGVDIEWPDLPETAPAWPADDILTTGVEPIAVEIEQAQTPTAYVPPLAPPTEDDRLARTHIARGFEAIQQKLYDQAKWEFEQARDLADDPEITEIAQAQLGELINAAIKVRPPRPAPSRPTLPRPTPSRPAQPRPTLPRQVRPIQPTRPKRPLPPITPTQTGPIAWTPVVITGLIVGVVNGVLTGCTAPFCVGTLLAPTFGFVAGLLIARNAPPVRDGQPSTSLSPIVAGGIAGFVGWLGQVIGYPVWLNSLPTSQSNTGTLLAFTACITGGFYIPVAAALGALGWRIGRKRT